MKVDCTRRTIIEEQAAYAPASGRKSHLNPRASIANSDRGISGSSVLQRPKMAEKRRADEQTSAQEPHSGVQGEGGPDPGEG
jgi:hypothetical protein